MIFTIKSRGEENKLKIEGVSKEEMKVAQRCLEAFRLSSEFWSVDSAPTIPDIQMPIFEMMGNLSFMKRVG